MRDVLAVFHRIHRRREGRSLEPLDVYSKVIPGVFVALCSKGARAPLQPSARMDVCTGPFCC